jgi:6,7-dimethyl-8-ribityllumazine synthase
MLKAMTSRRARARGGRFAIVGARYNARFTDALVRSAKAAFAAAGGAVEVFRVPGAFEIPVVAAELVRRDPAPFDALVCLGVIIRGETAHADLIGRAVTEALMRLQVDRRVPVIHEVLLLDNEAQARARCLGRLNRGREAAQTALEMATLFRRLRKVPSP